MTEIAPAGSPSLAEGEKVFSVSEITRGLKDLIEGEYPDVWVRGEISNFKLHGSGHAFLSLKDDRAVLEAVIFRFAQRKAGLGYELEDGTEVVAHGRIGLYEPHGRYRLIIEFVQPVGVGALLVRFEQLKRKLEQEGLFDPSRKKPLPVLPQRIGVVTSPTGAAVRDILTVLRRRFANVSVLIFPVRVQGEGAAEEIAAAVREMNRRADVDVLIVGRGGGSLEDLWAFNEEVVARAIYESRIPVISAVGHEIDVTIADFVADVRAPTPSAAAEMVVRSKLELAEKIGGLEARLGRALKAGLAGWAARLQQARRVLASPERRIEDAMMRLDDLLSRMENAQAWLLTQGESRLREAYRALLLLSPRHRVHQDGLRLEHLVQRLVSRTSACVDRQAQALSRVGAILDSLSPLAILKRGYSITYGLPSREILTEAKRVRRGDAIEVRLYDGELTARIVADPKQGKLIR